MAEMNLLRSDVTGSFGAHTGVRAKGKSIIKGKIWSKAPPNALQTNSLRAFEGLNRIASAVAKKYWYWLGFTQGNKHKHNVVASKFKIMVETHRFYPPRLSEVIPLGDKISLSDYHIDPISGKIELKVKAELPEIVSGRQSVLVMIFNGTGHIYYCERMKTPVLEVSMYAPVTTDFPYYAMAFSSTKEGKKIRLGNLAYQMTLPDNVFYTEPHTKIKWWTVAPNYLYGEGAGLSTEETTLVVDDTIG